MITCSNRESSAHERAPVLDRRRMGVVLHPTSLPGPGACGRLGASAFRFVDFLVESGLSVWQVLPLGPTHVLRSPYEGLSAHAGDPALICLKAYSPRNRHAPDYGPDGKRRLTLDEGRVQQACRDFAGSANAGERRAFGEFCEGARAWLEDYALFRAVRASRGEAPWWTWPEALRDRDRAALEGAARRCATAIEMYRFEQFQFHRQWHALKHYANQRDVLLFGDMPIFVAHDSAEVWAHREVFLIDACGRPEVVAGVPPDAFSDTGQRWGTPLYDWVRLAQVDFRWWVDRMATQLGLFDLIRVDHFRGFQAYWEIAASDDTAINGHWVEGPGAELFEALTRQLGPLPLVAEDLGYITPEVHALRERFGYPGMKVLQFAFDNDEHNPHLPSQFVENCVVYTGTHDNDTTLGWYLSLSAHARQRVCEFLGENDADMPWPLLRAASASAARLAMAPMQDLLGLDSTHRMNTPGTVTGNWHWRFTWEQLPAELPGRLRALVEHDRRDGT